MSDFYPLPRHAAYIWLTGQDTIAIGLPPDISNARGHTVCLPNNAVGVQALLMLLKERSKHTEFRIGQRQEPTQYQLDKVLDAMRQQKKVEGLTVVGKKRSADTSLNLEDLGL